jgi:hypothetical protein
LTTARANRFRAMLDASIEEFVCEAAGLPAPGICVILADLEREEECVASRGGVDAQRLLIDNKNLPDERQDKDEPPRLSWDPNAPPAPVDVHAFSRRAGEIIARAARAACKGFRRD